MKGDPAIIEAEVSPGRARGFVAFPKLVVVS